jgi:hypothetical protein
MSLLEQVLQAPAEVKDQVLKALMAELPVGDLWKCYTVEDVKHLRLSLEDKTPAIASNEFFKRLERQLASSRG